MTSNTKIYEYKFEAFMIPHAPFHDDRTDFCLSRVSRHLIRNMDLLRKKRKGGDEEEELVKTNDEASNDDGGSGEEKAKGDVAEISAVDQEPDEEQKEE